MHLKLGTIHLAESTIKLPSRILNTTQTPNTKTTTLFPLGKTPRTSERTRLTDAALHLHSSTPTFKKAEKKSRKKKEAKSFQDLKQFGMVVVARQRLRQQQQQEKHKGGSQKRETTFPLFPIPSLSPHFEPVPLRFERKKKKKKKFSPPKALPFAKKREPGGGSFFPEFVIHLSNGFLVRKKRLEVPVFYFLLLIAGNHFEQLSLDQAQCPLCDKTKRETVCQRNGVIFPWQNNGCNNILLTIRDGRWCPSHYIFTTLTQTRKLSYTCMYIPSKSFVPQGGM